MNKRIRELIERSSPLQEVLCETIDLTNRPPRYVKRKALLDFQLEKFAESIVRECAGVAAGVVIEHEGVDFGLVEACYKHFGVKT